MDAIATRGLTKDHGGRGIFDVTMAVAPGRIHGVLGTDGAGKTTLIAALMGLRPDAGQIRLFGHDIQKNQRERGRADIGHLACDPWLPGRLTGRQALDKSAGRRKLRTDQRHILAAALAVDLDTKLRELTPGQRQKVALLNALQHHPRLLILDEPTAHLDTLDRARLQDVLRQHAAKGGSVLLATRDMHVVQSLCDDVTVLHSGRVRLQATVAELLREEPAHFEATIEDLRPVNRVLFEAGATDIQCKGTRVRCTVHGDLMPAMRALVELEALHVAVHPPSLEAMFVRLLR